MFPYRMDRDTEFVSFKDVARITSWGLAVIHTVTDLNVDSDGLVNVDHGTIHINSNVTLAATQIQASGLHITGPVDEGGLTPYAYSMTAYVEDTGVMPFAFVGVSPASVIALDSVVENYRPIRAAVSQGDGWSVLNCEGIIACPLPFDDLAAGYENRALCFGIGMMSDAGTPAAAMAIARISVRRLVKSDPIIFDKFKLG